MPAQLRSSCIPKLLDSHRHRTGDQVGTGSTSRCFRWQTAELAIYKPFHGCGCMAHRQIRSTFLVLALITEGNDYVLTYRLSGPPIAIGPSSGLHLTIRPSVEETNVLTFIKDQTYGRPSPNCDRYDRTLL